MIVTTEGRARPTASLTAFSSLVSTRRSRFEEAGPSVTVFEGPKKKLTAAPAIAPAIRAAMTAIASGLRPNRLRAAPSSMHPTNDQQSYQFLGLILAQGRVNYL